MTYKRLSATELPMVHQHELHWLVQRPSKDCKCISGIPDRKVCSFHDQQELLLHNTIEHTAARMENSQVFLRSAHFAQGSQKTEKLLIQHLIIW